MKAVYAIIDAYALSGKVLDELGDSDDMIIYIADSERTNEYCEWWGIDDIRDGGSFIHHVSENPLSEVMVNEFERIFKDEIEKQPDRFVYVTDLDEFRSIVESIVL